MPHFLYKGIDDEQNKTLLNMCFNCNYFIFFYFMGMGRKNRTNS